MGAVAQRDIGIYMHYTPPPHPIDMRQNIYMNSSVDLDMIIKLSLCLLAFSMTSFCCTH